MVEDLQKKHKLLEEDYAHLRVKYEEVLQDLDKRAATIPQGQMGQGPSYKPGRGFRVPKSEYLVLENQHQPVPAGYCKLGWARSTVVVLVEWKEGFDRKIKKKTPSYKVKKMLDAFFDPWELQGHNSTTIKEAQQPVPQIIEAIRVYATDELGLKDSDFTSIFNSKAGTSKRAMFTIDPERAVPKKIKRKNLANTQENLTA